MKENEAKVEGGTGGGKGGRIPTMVGNPHQQTRGIRQERQVTIKAKVAQTGSMHRRNNERQRVGNRKMIKSEKGQSMKPKRRITAIEGGRRRN